jgi:hypothetical protein
MEDAHVSKVVMGAFGHVAPMDLGRSGPWDIEISSVAASPGPEHSWRLEDKRTAFHKPFSRFHSWRLKDKRTKKTVHHKPFSHMHSWRLKDKRISHHKPFSRMHSWRFKDKRTKGQCPTNLFLTSTLGVSSKDKRTKGQRSTQVSLSSTPDASRTKGQKDSVPHKFLWLARLTPQGQKDTRTAFRKPFSQLQSYAFDVYYPSLYSCIVVSS